MSIDEPQGASEGEELVGESIDESDGASEGEGVVGESIDRIEDEVFLTGRAKYAPDLQAPNMGHATILRSQYGHAEIVDIDTSPAREMDGVIAVYTSADMEAADTPAPDPIPNDSMPETDLSDSLCRRVLADERVRYQGEGLAIVVAEDKYTAHDAVDRIDVQYEQLDAVPSVDEALSPDAPAIHEDVADNVAYDWDTGDRDAVETQLAEAPNTVRVEVEEQRMIPDPLEPRSALVDFDPSTDELTIKMSTQCPHSDRGAFSKVLNHPEHKIRVVAPKVGGGFGSKIHNYTAESAVAWAAMELERPVKWEGTRTGIHQSSSQGRAMAFEGELAFDDDGTIRGLRADGVADLGGYVSSHTQVFTTYYCVKLLSGQYEIPEIYSRVRGVLTNKVSLDAYRGVNIVTSITLLERLMRAAAEELGMDPAEFRRRNMIPPEAFPYDTATGWTYDSGKYEAGLDQALDLVDYERLRERQAELREEDRYLGIGISSFAQVTGLGTMDVCEESGFKGHWETSQITMHPSGTVTAYCGTQDYGQGHATVYSQLVADELGIPMEDIKVVEGDTREVNDGTGTHASRSAVVGGAAIVESARKIFEKARAIAAHQLDATEEDIEFEEGEFSVAGSQQRSLTIQEVAEQAHLGYDLPGEPGLEATTYFEPEMLAITSGTHVAVVEIDPDTGNVEFENYVGVTDIGNQINPKIVDGQMHGGVVQGIGQALYEEARYDENANLVTGSLQDYTLPKAEQVPEMETEYLSTPSPNNPVGAKGVGETGPIAANPAVINAVVDALEPFEFSGDAIATPLTPEKIWSIIDDAEEGS